MTGFVLYIRPTGLSALGCDLLEEWLLGRTTGPYVTPALGIIDNGMAFLRVAPARPLAYIRPRIQFPRRFPILFVFLVDLVRYQGYDRGSHSQQGQDCRKCLALGQ